MTIQELMVELAKCPLSAEVKVRWEGQIMGTDVVDDLPVVEAIPGHGQIVMVTV